MWQKEIFEIASAIVLSVGGAGAIIVAATSFLSNRIANRLEEKYRLKLDMELEKCKANFEQRTYISRIQFDTEIAIYRELTKGIYEFLVALNTSVNDKDYPKAEQHDASEKIEQERTLYIKMVDRSSHLQSLLYENAAFIPKSLYDECKALIEVSSDQFWIYIERFNMYLENHISQCERVTSCEKNTFDTLEKDFENFNNHLREYLRNLVIVD